MRNIGEVRFSEEVKCCIFDTFVGRTFAFPNVIEHRLYFCCSTFEAQEKHDHKKLSLIKKKYFLPKSQYTKDTNKQ